MTDYFEDDEYTKYEIEFWKNTTLRCLAIKKALKQNDIKILYSTLNRFLSDKYTKHVEPYFVNDCAYFLWEWGTTGLCVRSTENDEEESPIEYISLELSKAIFELNTWGEILGSLENHNVIVYDDPYEKNSKHDINIVNKINREDTTFLLVQERLAEELKKEKPTCRVFIYMRELEIIMDEKGNISKKYINKRDMPSKAVVLPEFLYNFENTETINIDGREVKYVSRKK